MLGFMAVALFTSATGQETNKSKPEPSLTSAREKTVFNIWPGVAPGSEQWKQPETVIGSAGNQRIMNVSAPTLTAYLPDPSTATGTSVLIAPGGGFVWLSIDSEGHDVAKWLAARGIAAFVLKYRLLQVEGQEPAQVAQAAAGQECIAADAITSALAVPLVRLKWTSLNRKAEGLICGRNAFLLLGALMELRPTVGILALGIHAGTNYADCSPEFISGMQQIFNLYTCGRVQAGAPFLDGPNPTFGISVGIENCQSS